MQLGLDVGRAGETCCIVASQSGECLVNKYNLEEDFGGKTADKVF